MFQEGQGLTEALDLFTAASAVLAEGGVGPLEFGALDGAVREAKLSKSHPASQEAEAESKPAGWEDSRFSLRGFTTTDMTLPT